MEDYLKAIVMISRGNEIVRVKDLARRMNRRQSSVNYALKKLKESGLIEHEKYGCIELTKKGEDIGSQIYAKFNYLSDFFRQVLEIESPDIGVIACKMEHCINNEIKRRINNLLSFYRYERKLNREWIKRRRKYLLENKGEI